jgi:uncharacterized protein YndB with AHSA1/START domain
MNIGVHASPRPLNNTGMTRSLTGQLLLVVLSSLGSAAVASADVVDSAANGFSIRITADVNAPRAEVYRVLTEQVGRWWTPEHTYSGSAANLSIEPRAGACFCERLTNGSVQHMTVSRVDAPQTLVMQGGLGPLGTMGVVGAMTWTLEEREGRTALQLTYSVGGYSPAGLNALAPVVDGVLATQVKRLKAFAETGRPE